jgi:hypothetical protein
VKESIFDFDAVRHLRQNFKSVIEIASGKKDTWDETDEQLKLMPEEAYYAVLCFDGDEMGQWVSGAKAPALIGQLSREAREYFQEKWQPDKASSLSAESVRRVLTPSYHAALSEALNNFALYCVRPVVQRFDGQLIYCGGDDVLAMLPAANALACAEALYWTFRGQLPDTADAVEVFNSPALDVLDGRNGLFEFLPKGDADTLRGGFVRLRKPAQGQPRWPFLVPGPRATASVGIAVGHARSPMQDTIQAAREAEKQAKKHYGRDAFCLRILKRSGEALDIGGHWRDTDRQHAALAAKRKELDGQRRKDRTPSLAPAQWAELRECEEACLPVTRRHPRLILIESLLAHFRSEARNGVSARLPYRLGQLLRPLDLNAKLDGLTEVLQAETEHVLKRQAEGLRKRDPAAYDRLCQQANDLLARLKNWPESRVRDYLNPFLAAAWLAKHPGATAPQQTQPEPATPEVAHA